MADMPQSFVPRGAPKSFMGSFPNDLARFLRGGVFESLREAGERDRQREEGFARVRRQIRQRWLDYYEVYG